jgi:hypothetical protein
MAGYDGQEINTTGAPGAVHQTGNAIHSGAAVHPTSDAFAIAIRARGDVGAVAGLPTARRGRRR